MPGCRHRIETSFAQHDLEGTGMVSKDQIGKIMEDLGHRYVDSAVALDSTVWDGWNPLMGTGADPALMPTLVCMLCSCDAILIWPAHVTN